MASTTTAAGAADHLDPWGFGRCDDGGRPVVEDVQNPVAPATLAALEAHDDRDRTDAFPPFAVRHAAVRPTAEVRAGTREWLAVLAVFALAVLGQAFYIGYRLSAATPDASLGTLVVSSHPSGLQVLVDGRVAGTTPLALAAPAGLRRVEVGTVDGALQVFEPVLVAGEQWTQHIDGAAAAASGGRGAVAVETPGAVASVIIDGELAGQTPLASRDITPGEHVVRLVYANGGALERRVAVTAGERVSILIEAPSRRGSAAALPAAPPVRQQAVAPSAPAPVSRASAPPAPAPALGWVRVEAPFEVEVYEQGTLLGSSGLGPVSLPAGGHVLELVNEALGYRVRTKAAVLTGKTARVQVEAPRAVVHLNAQPWAEVFVDGRLLGETPLANVMLPIGHHQLVFRHPELGERTQAFTVRASGPNRIAADLRR